MFVMGFTAERAAASALAVGEYDLLKSFVFCFVLEKLK